MMENFERSTKPTFKDPSVPSYLKFGSMRDRDPDVGIRSGQLTLEGYVCACKSYSQSPDQPCSRSEMARFFEPSVTAIATAIRAQRMAATEPISVRSPMCLLALY